MLEKEGNEKRGERKNEEHIESTYVDVKTEDSLGSHLEHSVNQWCSFIHKKS